MFYCVEKLHGYFGMVILNLNSFHQEIITNYLFITDINYQLNCCIKQLNTSHTGNLHKFVIMVDCSALPPMNQLRTSL